MQARVEQLLARLPEIEELLGQPDTLKDQKRFKELSQEHAYLSGLKDAWELYLRCQRELEQSRALLKETDDVEFQEVILSEIAALEKSIVVADTSVQTLLVPPDPRDHRPIIIELRAGTGGEEAALFVADCVRMYRMYADKKRWQFEPLSCTLSDMGGFKEYVMSLSGPNVFRSMQYEAGTHRVQRVPATESQGRVHTSAITIAVLLEPDEEEEIAIDEKELRIDTYRSSGAGGQHVNTTDSAVRITHLPTGTVVYCQEERSQHKNKDKAMRFLKAKLAEEKQRAQAQEIASLRSSQIGSGDRSERIRTYNFPQNRVTDHRIGLTLYQLDYVLEGELDPLTQPLVSHFYQQRLAGASGD